MRLPDQEPPSPPWEAPASEQREQYVRLRVRVRDGQLSVIDSPILVTVSLPSMRSEADCVLRTTQLWLSGSSQ